MACLLFGHSSARSFAGKVIPSERSKHVILEKWHPLGVVGVISAFNFPNAVFGWNSAIALTVGNSVLWKGAETTPLVSVATTKIVADVFQRNNLPAVSTLCQGAADIGKAMARDKRINLLSFTGSTNIGHAIGVEVQKRFGKFILELGGNNALLVNEDANFENALNAAFFGCVGSSGQRCTATRRLIVHEKLYDRFVTELTKKHQNVSNLVLI